MKLKKILKIAYISVFFLFLSVVGICSFVIKEDTSGKEKPVELEYTGYKDWSKGFDTYFSSNFAFRKSFIQMDSMLKYNLFNYTGEREVIAGKDDWLFYEQALKDYDGSEILSDAEIEEIADAIERLSEEVKKQGGDMVFVVAPNKMEVYGEYMPYYLKESPKDGNYEKLMKALSQKDVKYVDLKNVLKSDSTYGDIKLYHKWDSHWNNLGAAVAYREIMKTTELQFTDYSDIPFVSRTDFNGDLYSMHFPKGDKKDVNYYFDVEYNYDFTSNFKSVDDLIITTENQSGTGKVILYRDSFGNALYEFFANDFSEAYISRALPYDVSDIEGADLVVVEIVERNIPRLKDAYRADA